MRELTVRIRFTRHSLGSAQDRTAIDGRLIMPRLPDGRVAFLPNWHHANMKLAAQLLNRHQAEVNRILWDVAVDCAFRRDRWYRRHYTERDGGRRRFAVHEAFFPGDVVGVNCIVPPTIPDDDLLQLMNIAGRYKGLSPWSPGTYGHFEVEGIRPRRGPSQALGPIEKTEAVLYVVERKRKIAAAGSDPAAGKTVEEKG